MANIGAIRDGRFIVELSDSEMAEVIKGLVFIYDNSPLAAALLEIFQVSLDASREVPENPLPPATIQEVYEESLTDEERKSRCSVCHGWGARTGCALPECPVPKSIRHDGML